MFSFFFFFNDTATTEIYTLSLHDALPILNGSRSSIRSGEFSSRNECVTCCLLRRCFRSRVARFGTTISARCIARRSEEHTSELQSHLNLVCRLLLEKKKKAL